MKHDIPIRERYPIISLRKIAGELIGTFLLVLIGCGSVAALLFVRLLEPLLGPVRGACDCTSIDTFKTGEKST